MRVAVVGGGVFGASAAWACARAGHEVDLFEAEDLPSPRASSADRSKVIRATYGPATALYAPLAWRAFDRWAEVERLTGERLVHRCGVLLLERRHHPESFGGATVAAMRALGRTLEVVDATEGRRRWPHLRWDGLTAVVDPDAGWIDATRGVRAIARAAIDAGARVHLHAAVVEVDPVDVAVRLADGWRRFDRIVVAAGPWVRRLLPVQARVTRQQVALFDVPLAADLRGMPVWLHELADEAEDGGWYGFPQGDDGVVKVGLHRRSEEVDPDDPRRPDDAFRAAARRFAASLLGARLDRVPAGRVCLYTSSPSGDLRIGPLPGAPSVVVAGLGSGHGFKFGPVLGDLALDALEGRQIPEALTADGSGPAVW